MHAPYPALSRDRTVIQKCLRNGGVRNGGLAACLAAARLAVSSRTCLTICFDRAIAAAVSVRSNRLSAPKSWAL